MPDTLARVRNRPSLSIVIPVGPAETAHLALLECLSGFPATRLCAPFEVVLSGCGESTQKSVCKPIQGRDCIHVSGPAGRAAQLNRGVAAASGRCLWLLHADSRPTPAAMVCAAEFAVTGDESVRAGALGWFPLSFGNDGPRLSQLNAVGANMRSLNLHLPFGDQAWLLSRDVFDALGGFDEQFGRGEDLDFIRRARRAGIRLRRQKAVISTSARRYREKGWLRTTLAHLWLTLRLWFKAGRKPGKLPN